MGHGKWFILGDLQECGPSKQLSNESKPYPYINKSGNMIIKGNVQVK